MTTTLARRRSSPWTMARALAGVTAGDRAGQVGELLCVVVLDHHPHRPPLLRLVLVDRGRLLSAPRLPLRILAQTALAAEVGQVLPARPGFKHHLTVDRYGTHSP